MKLLISALLLGYSIQALALDEPRTNCPKTRPCKVDKDCRIYAFKHNCHAQCQTISLKFPDNKQQECSAQCLCIKTIKLTNA